MTSIEKLEDKIDRCTQVLVRKFAECAENDASVDLSEWVQWYEKYLLPFQTISVNTPYRYTFDVVGELFFSRMFGFLEGAYDYGGYIGALDMLIPLIAVACVSHVFLRPLVLLSGAVVPRVSKALTALKHIESAAEARVIERRHLLNSYSDKCFTDMLQHFFNVMHDQGMKKDFGMTEVKMEIYGALYAYCRNGTGRLRLTTDSIAGSDTTAAAISAILYHLMRTPSAYAKLTEEIDAARKETRLSENVQYREAKGLPYLVACCKEAMRLHPSVGMTLPRYVPPGGCVIAGQWFPGGTRIGVNAAVVQRNRQIFGDDADDFIPERWLGADGARMERYMFQVRRPVFPNLFLQLTSAAVWWRRKNMYRKEREYAPAAMRKVADKDADIPMRNIQSRAAASERISPRAEGARKGMENAHLLVPQAEQGVHDSSS
jgi:hypothetical protein